MGSIRNSLSIFLGTLLFISLFGFIIASSFSQVVSVDVFDATVDEFIDEGVDDVVSEVQFSPEEIESEILKQCENEEIAALLAAEFSIDCDDVKNTADTIDFGDLIKEEAKKEVYAREEVQSVRNGISHVEKAPIYLGIISAGLAISILALSLNIGFVVIGVVGILLGLPLLFLGFVSNSFDNVLQSPEYEVLPTTGLNTISSLFDSFISLLGVYLLFSLVAGIILLVVGILVYRSRSKEGSGKRVSENKKG